MSLLLVWTLDPYKRKGRWVIINFRLVVITKDRGTWRDLTDLISLRLTNIERYYASNLTTIAWKSVFIGREDSWVDMLINALNLMIHDRGQSPDLKMIRMFLFEINCVSFFCNIVYLMDDCPPFFYSKNNRNTCYLRCVMSKTTMVLVLWF